uniref:DNA-directed RNA polymerase subunit n=1 Tax=Rhizochromulina marina TaxID=1034831 RepID=A0A7S2STF7_9STRA|mmetsp:Transcript_5345/g.15709  ORF Transcript_5345/g.15709 Transcript_5345/m.15709 type:complete len:107 (+) Transcript_5345:183-503(+)|eukprot:CAMPEP_0118973916 /NCGR_PEP_ID=MMETSP1173-20130426/10975_1 /TAXON_ID=1034831 /ORGANISM="Rhizochromulina marina cf, Strain CCMP1243" /LENGTH=106 /DNA_ID=CAMNT_0006923613 /DNA_START=183 /DNA_END=503 /DNA_ORIENTATION=+
MWFCPWDGSLLKVSQSGVQTYLLCPLCPYKHTVLQSFKINVPTTKKKVDDVLGGAKAWENVDKTEHRCPACGHDEAYFMQIQIRSADEPMSSFYKCVKCGTMDAER